MLGTRSCVAGKGYRSEMIKSLSILSSVLAVAVIVLGISTYYYKQELNDARDIVSPLEEEMLSLKLSNGAKTITIEGHNGTMDAKQGELDQSNESLAIQFLLTERYKNETRSLAIYIEFMQKLCDANNIRYPYYVVK